MAFASITAIYRKKSFENPKNYVEHIFEDSIFILNMSKFWEGYKDIKFTSS